MKGVSYAGELVLCKRFIHKSEHRCVIKRGDEDPRKVKKGDRVLVYSRDGTDWIATGDLIVVKGAHSIGIFKNADSRISKGMKVVFEDPLSAESQDMGWDGAFD